MLDILFINPGAHSIIYQDLANKFSAIEPPTWALLLASSVRKNSYNPKILDMVAEGLTNEEAFFKINSLAPRLICFVVYGQNPNSGSINMTGAIELADYIKKNGLKTKILFVGSHVSALPFETLENESSIDLVATNEGVYAINNLLSLDNFNDENLSKVKGIAYKDLNNKIIKNDPEIIVPQSKMDEDLPGYAWDLLPYKEKPLDLYRSHFWHSGYRHDHRTPFAAIYTSLGCMFKCEFCMINILNKIDNAEIGVASDYAKMRFWSPDFIINEIDYLYSIGVRTLRFSDEMFLLNKKYYVPLCEKLIDRGYGNELNIWVYSRIDTVKDDEQLQLIRKAGIRWVALGIESADMKIRKEVTKGKFEDINIKDVVKKCEANDVEVIANYMFGLPGDTFESMQKTLDLSLELNTLGWNAYPAMPFPGSKLYKIAREQNKELPQKYSEYSYHSYDSCPFDNGILTKYEILSFRDNAFHVYHENESFLKKIGSKFGNKAVENIKEMSKIKLKRKKI